MELGVRHKLEQVFQHLQFHWLVSVQATLQLLRVALPVLAGVLGFVETFVLLYSLDPLLRRSVLFQQSLYLIVWHVQVLKCLDVGSFYVLLVVVLH